MQLLLKNAISSILIGFIVTIITGCETVAMNETQTITIETTPKDTQGGACTAENNKGIRFLTATPGTVTVTRSLRKLHIVCEKPGFKTTERYLCSTTPYWSFGNGVFGGLYGAGIDNAGGSFYTYPDKVVIRMIRIVDKSPPVVKAVSPPPVKKS